LRRKGEERILRGEEGVTHLEMGQRQIPLEIIWFVMQILLVSSTLHMILLW
jgi:hypothetical protein